MKGKVNWGGFVVLINYYNDVVVRVALFPGKDTANLSNGKMFAIYMYKSRVTWMRRGSLQN